MWTVTTGAIIPVTSYREKLLGLNKLSREQLQGSTPHVCVPSGSILDGVLIDRDDVTLTGLREGADQRVIVRSQVEMVLLFASVDVNPSYG